MLAIPVFFCVQLAAAQTDSWKGTRLTAYLEFLNRHELRLIYSSDLVGEELTLLVEPNAADPKATLDDILRPHGLTFVDGPAGSLLIVRRLTESPPEPAPETTPRPEVPLPEIVVTSSFNRLEYVHSGSHTYLDRELATRIPAAGEEAVRLTQRLPSTANGGVSARSHIRGGEVNEVLFLLDGLRLYEPYHLKDFQSVATIINSHAIAGIDFYSGGYPARYGDRMSGVVSLSLREPARRIETELALSFFNASALSLGTFGSGDRGDWLVAARRGNLDLIADVVDPEFGSPDYQDYLLHAGWNFGPRARISANFLASTDKIVLADVDLGEEADARYKNRVAWVRWDSTWTDRLRSETMLSFSDIENRRLGTLNLPGIVSGSIDDEREFRAFEFRQDWQFVPSPHWMLRLGFSTKDFDASYRHSSVKSISAPFDRIFDNQPLVSRFFELAPGGAQFAAYSELRWQPDRKITIDLGLRFDQQNYTSAQEDDQLSPRAGVLYRIGKDTEMRLGWGRFYQAQEINELQVSDGISEFFPAQQAEHIVANLKHTFTAGVELDLSLYRKRFRTLRPRFENAFNTLVINPEIQFDRIRIDAGSAESYGAEFTISHGDADESLIWWLGYAWSKVQDTVADAKVRRSWDQTNTVKAGISWRWGAWDLSAAGELHTGWPKTELIEETATNPDGSAGLAIAATERNSLQYSINHSVDIRVSRNFDIRRGNLTAFFEVTNLYDRANPCCTEYSLSDDANGVSLVSRESHWLPLVPSLGIVWRF